MKIPTTPKERIQFFALVGLSGAILITVVVVFGLRPMLKERARLTAQLAKSHAELDEARATVRRAREIEDRLHTASNRLAAVTNQYVVTRVLGSYPVQQTVRTLAAAARFDVTTIREIGRTLTPSPAPPPAGSSAAGKGKPAPEPHPSFVRYTAEVTGLASYESAVRLLDSLEQENPFAGILNLEIRAVPTTPERHRVVFTVEWPVMAEASDLAKKKR